MLKIHKGLKKKKKDKKHKRKEEDDLFDEKEFEKYRKEHQLQQQQQQQQGQQSDSNEGKDGASADEPSSSCNSDEWQKFKALTAGIDCVLQKTQEDLDRIKSTSFFQRKPVTSSVPAKDSVADSQNSAEVVASSGAEGCAQKASKVGAEAATNVTLVDGKKRNEEGESDLHDEEYVDDDDEEVAAATDEEEDIFNTSYVDAVASGELKLAYIPDSPTEEQPSDAGYDPFDTSIADKFVVTNPKKRYLNLGCAVQVLSGQLDKSAQSSIAANPAQAHAKRRIVKPIQLLLDSFDEGSNQIGDYVPSLDSPVKTLLDEDPVLFGDKTPACEILPPIAVNLLPTAPSPLEAQSSSSTLPVESLSLAEFDVLAGASVPVPATAPLAGFIAKPTSIDSCSSSSLDDEFAELAVARKSSSTAFATTTASVGPTNSSSTFDEQRTRNTPPQPSSSEPDPFDTSIVDKLITDADSCAVTQRHSPTSTLTLTQLEDDDDFDPRAGDNLPPTTSFQPTQIPFFVPATTASPATTRPSDASAIVSPTLSDTVDVIDDYDPFDTSHVTELSTVESHS